MLIVGHGFFRVRVMIRVLDGVDFPDWIAEVQNAWGCDYMSTRGLVSQSLVGFLRFIMAAYRISTP